MYILKDLCGICGGLIVVRYVKITDREERRRLGSEMLVDGANCLDCLHEVIVPSEDYKTFVSENGEWIKDA